MICNTDGAITIDVCLSLASGKVAGLQTGKNADGSLGAIGSIILRLAA